MPQLGEECLDWGRVAVIGEFTTPSGPGGDDWFLVIAFTDGRFAEYPIGGAVCDRILQEAKNRSISVPLKFASCTEFTSVVHFPESIAGSPALELVKQSPPRRSWIKRWLDPRIEMIEYGLSKVVLDHLGIDRESAPS